MDLYTRYKSAFSGLSLPFAWVDLDQLDRNIALHLKRARSMPIRIASKSIRSVAILRYLLNASAHMQGIMCYHPREAAWLAGLGFDDLLIAYPSLDRAALDAALTQVAQGKTIYFMVDLPEHAQAISELAKQRNVTALLCLDLDLSIQYPLLYFGVHRSNVRNADDAVALYKKIRALPNLELRGVMGYEAQIAGLGDKVPGQAIKNMAVRLLKQNAIPKVECRRTNTVLALRAAGADIRLVNGGGTGSVESTIAEPSVTEVTVGSGFYCSHLFDYYQAFHAEPAAGFALQVTRSPGSHLLTCNGGGYVASGPADKLKLPQPYLPAGMRLEPNEGAGEVQTPIHVLGSNLRNGDPVFFRHAKAGELCERFNTLHLLRGTTVEDQVNTYRGDGQVFM
ncbi:MAG TPA: amino acid deaminase/aldolase [Dongiaceae bacterium]|nr:amino acid deaminase/aldolase [Dongiaceae bacterium]